MTTNPNEVDIITNRIKSKKIKKHKQEIKQLKREVIKLQVIVCVLAVAFVGVYGMHTLDESGRDTILKTYEDQAWIIYDKLQNIDDNIDELKPLCLDSDGFYTGNAHCRQIDTLTDEWNRLNYDLNSFLIKMGVMA